MTVGEKGVGRRFDRFSALSKSLDLRLWKEVQRGFG